MSDKIKGLEFHIKSQDYFGTLATVLSLVRQDVEKGANKDLCIKTLKNVQESLVYLQKKYRIISN